MRVFRRIGLALPLVAAPIGPASLVAAAPELRPLRAGTGLLVDDVRISRRENVVRRIQPATKLPQPVLLADQPWERGGAVRIDGTTHYEPATGEFRMW